MGCRQPFLYQDICIVGNTPPETTNPPNHPSTIPDIPSTNPDHPSTNPVHTSTKADHTSTNPDHTSTCDGGTTRLSGTSGSVISPGYSTGLYPHNARCRWRIDVPRGYVSIMFQRNRSEMPTYRFVSVDIINIYQTQTQHMIGLAT